MTAVLAETEELSAGQFAQAASPDAILYFPASQAEHEPPLRPVYPATHEQFKEFVLPEGEMLLDPHVVQPKFPIALL